MKLINQHIQYQDAKGLRYACSTRRDIVKHLIKQHAVLF